MKIVIAGHDSRYAINRLKQVFEGRTEKPNALILHDIDCPVPEYVAEHAEDWLSFQFQDIRSGKSRPEREHIEKILDWAKGKTDIVVACHAGISRSSACAYAIVCQEVGITEALAILDPNYHCPNWRIVYLASKILKNEAVWDKFVDWNDKHQNVSKSKMKAFYEQC
jgi:predicted protein tyrosine phosphatase